MYKLGMCGVLLSSVFVSVLIMSLPYGLHKMWEQLWDKQDSFTPLTVFDHDSKWDNFTQSLTQLVEEKSLSFDAHNKVTLQNAHAMDEKRIITKFHETLSAEYYQVTRVLQVVNPSTWLQYDIHRQLSQGSIQEVMLWHGTSLAAARNIAEHGFDFMYAAPGSYGTGIYGATEAAISDGYAQQFSLAGRRCMLYCSFQVGKGNANAPLAHNYNRAQLFASLGKKYSVNANKAHCVYNSAQVYPSFIVEYQML